MFMFSLSFIWSSVMFQFHKFLCRSFIPIFVDLFLDPCESQL